MPVVKLRESIPKNTSRMCFGCGKTKKDLLLLGTIYFLTQKREKEGIQIGRFQAIHSHICGVTGRLYESFYVSQPLKNLCATHPPRCLSVFVILKFHFSQLESVL